MDSEKENVGLDAAGQQQRDDRTMNTTTSYEGVDLGRSERSKIELAEREEQLKKKRQNLRRLWSLFKRLAGPYWKAVPASKRDIGFVMILGLMHSAFSVGFSYAGRYFMNALQKKDEDHFWNIIIIYSIMLAFGVPVVVFYDYCKDLTILRWREWLTKRVLTDYFTDKNYYSIDSTSDVDNPDQRIAEDIRSFTRTSIHFFMTMFFAVIDLCNFSFILSTIYPRLFIVLIVYSVGGTAITILIGRRLISLNFAQLQKEADFRFSLIRVRANAESIAFYAGYRQGREQYETERFFLFALDNQLSLIQWTRNLNFWTRSYEYALKVVPYTVVAPLYFAGYVELGVVSQSAQAFHHILMDLSILVRQFDHLSEFSAGIDRLGELEEALKLLELENWKGKRKGRDAADLDYFSSRTKDDGLPYDGPDDEWTDIDLLNVENGTEKSKIVLEEKNFANAPVVIENLDVFTPDNTHRLLFSSLNAQLEAGRSLLIVGPSGCGKSSLLRALAGLWNIGSGKISRPASQYVFFLPQKPYCTIGTFREQLVYPRTVGTVQKSEEELLDALEVVNLRSLPERMGGFEETRNWSAVLSLGEQQRLAFARVIVNEPALCVLDEATSALDVQSEKRVYQHLQSMKMTYISVGHRPSLLQYHDLILRLAFDAENCQIEPITNEMRRAAGVAADVG